MISGETLYVKVQNLTTPLLGKYAGPVEGQYRNCPNIKLTTLGGNVILQGTSGLNKQFSNVPLGAQVTVTFVSKQEFFDEKGKRKEYIESRVELLEPESLGLAFNEDYISQKDLALLLAVPANAMFQLAAFGFIVPEKEGNALFYKKSEVNKLKTNVHVKTWITYYGESDEVSD